MEDYKNLIRDSGYMQCLMKEICKVKNFDAVPEELYYEAVLTRRELKHSGSNNELLGVLDSFIKMCNVEKLTGSSVSLLTSKNKHPRGVTTNIRNVSKSDVVEAETAKALIVYCAFGTIIIAVLIILTLSMDAKIVNILLAVVPVILMVGLVVAILGDISFIFIADIVSGWYEKGEKEVKVYDIEQRTHQFLRKLDTEDSEKLSKQLSESERYTSEYYELCADIEEKYFESRYPE